MLGGAWGERDTGSCEVIDIIERGSDAGNDERGTKSGELLAYFQGRGNPFPAGISTFRRDDL